MRHITMLTIALTLGAAACSSDQATSGAPTTQLDALVTSTEPEVSSEPGISAAPDASDPIATEASPVVDSDPTSTPEGDTATTEPEPLVAHVVTEDDLTLFIAAAERSLEGSAQESAIFDDPEIYIAIGQAACARFTTGESFETVAIDLLADLDTGGSNDEARLVGAILGAATQTLCPEHGDKI